VSDLRGVNARLREMVALMAEQATARDNLVGLQADQLAAQKALIDSQDTQISNQDTQIGNQGRLIEGLTAELEQVRGLVEALEAELAKLRAQVGKDSTTSSVPPSQDSIEAKARQKAERRDTSQRERSADRRPGGQPGRRGSGLEPTRDPGRTERAAAPVVCPCGQQLSAEDEVGSAWAQVWDIAPVQLEKVHWVLPRYRCGCCAKTSTAVVPFASPGAVVYGPNVNAAAVLLASQWSVPDLVDTQLSGLMLR